MQVQRKLMNQTSENGEKANFGPNLGPFSPNLGPQIFFANLPLLVAKKIVQAIILCNLKEN